MKRYVPILLILGVMVLVIAALFQLTKPSGEEQPGGDGNGGGAEEAVAVRVISPHNEGILTEFKRAFEAWHQERFGAPCELVWGDRGGASNNVQFILGQFQNSPGGINLDIFWGGGAPYFMDLAADGYLEPCPLPEDMLAQIPETLSGVPVYDSEHRWYGSAMSSFGILYNRKQLVKMGVGPPQTWADLGSPDYLNEIAAADPRASGSAYAMIEIILQAYGWEKGFEVLTRMAANTKKFENSASAVVEDVSRRDVAAGLAIDFYAASAIKEAGEELLGFTLPAGLTPVTPDPIALLKGAPHPVQARRFIEFVMSPAGQKLWILPPGVEGGPGEFELLRIPARPDVFRQYAAQSTAGYTPDLFDAEFDYSADLAAARARGLKDLYGAVLMDVAPDLRDAWEAIIERGMKPDEIRRLASPPVTEQGLIEFSQRDWEDQRKRNEMIAEWTREAHERYRRLAE